MREKQIMWKELVGLHKKILYKAAKFWDLGTSISHENLRLSAKYDLCGREK